MKDTTSPVALPAGMSDPLTAGDVTRLFNVDPKTVTRWHNRGIIRAIRTPGGHRRFPWAQFPPLLAPDEPGTAPAADAPAALRLGSQYPIPLLMSPVAVPVTEAGRVTLILGYSGGKPVTVDVTRLGWLDDLDDAIQTARAAGVVEAGMAVPA